MRLRRPLLILLALGLPVTLWAHDLFLKLADFRVAPHQVVQLTALNGTFTTSENSITRSRIADLSLVSPTGRERLDTSAVTKAGVRTAVRIETGTSGTYVAGMSIRPSEISLDAKAFNAYLAEEGLGNVVAARRQSGELTKPARERYAKHVKAVFQAGPELTDGWKTVLGYPAEIVPLANPYQLARGDTLRLRLLVNGNPAGSEIEAIAGGRTPAGARIPVQHLRPGNDGAIAVALTQPGTWYVKFISMTRVSQQDVNYLSQWATLTFALSPSRSTQP